VFDAVLQLLSPDDSRALAGPGPNARPTLVRLGCGTRFAVRDSPGIEYADIGGYDTCPVPTPVADRAHRRMARHHARSPSMARILVTGGAGFLGSHLCDRLLDDGHDVLCADNFFTGSKRNIAHRLDHPYFELIRHDVTFPLYVEVDQIYNLACPASPVHYQHDPVQTTKTSVHGAINMLGLAKRLKARILQASTSEVYGDPEVHPQPEGYWGRVNPIGIRSCYDEGKRCAETLFFDYHRQHDLDIKVVRIFNTYGPRMHPNDGRVVSNFIVQALRGEDITIYGDGLQTRSFCYVDDLIEAFVRMMGTEAGFTGPINIGNPGEFTMVELAEKVLSLVGGRSKLVYRPLPSDDPKQRQPDIALAKSKLGWEPKIALEDGLKETIAYFRRTLDGAAA
jgi:UDP-glucuronate decarboxylase